MIQRIVLFKLKDEYRDVKAYIPDPDHRAYVDGYAMPKVAFRKAWNFEI